jgi:hypothetical protein
MGQLLFEDGRKLQFVLVEEDSHPRELDLVSR